MGCGSSSSNNGGNPHAVDGVTANRGDDADSDAGEGGEVDEAAANASDAGPSSTVCDDLTDAAAAQVGPIVAQHVACNQDSDCTTADSDPAGYCVAACGWVVNTAGVAAAQSAFDQACQPFVAKGCPPPYASCPAQPVLCAGGTCATYNYYFSPYPLPNFTHGVCTALQLNYAVSAGSPNASHDLVVPVSTIGGGGTLYSDAACTVPATGGSLTIPAGSSSVAFGFIPSAAGSFTLSINSGGVSGGTDNGTAL
ncbi:MAG TPA: hypothetical protein VHV30_00810 [Polyangiaceae bacterium]|jgi:hypothetical protein|nr:hypothetical protein [Polyangiaceae bacterium]